MSVTSTIPPSIIIRSNADEVIEGPPLQYYNVGITSGPVYGRMPYAEITVSKRLPKADYYQFQHRNYLIYDMILDKIVKEALDGSSFTYVFLTQKVKQVE